VASVIEAKRRGTTPTGVIKCQLSRAMGERSLLLADVSRDTESHRNTVTQLYFETASRIDLDTIDKRCQFFGGTVSDLFEFIPSAVRKKA
jgi:putative transcriptional regulator